MHKVIGIGTIGLVVGLAACDDGGLQNGATLAVELTDASSEYIGAAWVDIGRVELVPADDGAPMVVAEDGTAGEVNLLDLTGAVTQTLGSVELEAGTSIQQVRLIVESARVQLADGYEFNGGGNEQELTVPSGAQTGIKLVLSGSDGADGGFVVPEGGGVLVIDFDVARSFVIQGSPGTPAGISGVHFQPTLRAVLRDVSSSLSGQVTTALQGVDVNGLTVTADPGDGSLLELFQTASATAATAGDAEAAGSYSFAFLVPGTYTVSVALPETEAYAGLAVDPASREVEVGEAATVVDVDFSIVEAPSPAGGS